ncbi:hypothetical protein DOH76_27300 [Salmonella enterica subsp. enterica serovar Oranienburg]|nr:hypothetical protein [Salmonella enterica]EBG5027417.1 hypothetical protein [Salmonella enterica subsp. enterica serovar Oranienburg]EAS1264923.1 hypothetical protein [Salmonella enterica]EBB1607435.1 hypothetical protein [Salmonella enterica]EBB9534538.1 hypothetical protein [Salmonella enterica]
MTLAETLKQEGRQEGAIEEAQKIARQLQKMGMKPEQIKHATGLTEEELKRSSHRQNGDHI